jgi:NAD(P)H-flavin reductase
VALVTAPLLGITPVTPRSRLLQVDLRDNLFPFRAGQAVLIGMHGRPERRPYSIACSPERASETSRLELLIALEQDGELGPHFVSPSPGALVDLEGPLGTFIFPEDPPQQWLLFVAGGTGIAPLRSMIDHVLRRNSSRHVSVLYSARRSDEFAFIEELRDHAKARRLDLHQTVTRDDSSAWEGGRGRIGRSHFEAVLHEPAKTLCFVCGPRDMVAGSVVSLQELDVPPDAIRTEGWKLRGV